MSNVVTDHTLEIFEDDVMTIKEYLKISLYTIFFHRWLNNNNYTDQESSINNISYKKIQNDLLEKEINNLINNVDSYSENYNKLQITVNIYTKETRSYFFYTKKEGLWEKWNFLIKIINNGSSDKEDKVRKYVSKVIRELNVNLNNMPDIDLDDFENINDINNNDIKSNNFPFDININTEFDQDSILSIFKNLNVRDSYNMI
jgi:hypothetical protein